MNPLLTRITTVLLAVLLFLTPLSVAAEATRGDPDGNGKINTSDARWILQVAAGKITLTDETVDAADTNKDGKVNTSDARRILQFVAGIITDFDQPEKAPATNYENEVFVLINQYRTENGLPALTYRHDVQAAANRRAEEIVTLFSHTRPNGNDCFSVFKEFGVEYYAAGENIAMGYQTAESVMEAWMNSPGHRANILRTYFTGVAVGVVEKDGCLYWVQLFIA